MKAYIKILASLLCVVLILGGCMVKESCKESDARLGFMIEIPFIVSYYDKETLYIDNLRSRGLMDSTDRFSNYLMGFFLYNDSLIPYPLFYGSQSGFENILWWNLEFLYPQNPNWERERWYRYGETVTDTLLLRFVYDCPDQTDTFFVSYTPVRDPVPDCPSRERVTLNAYKVRHKSVHGEYHFRFSVRHPANFPADTIEYVDDLNVSLPCEP